MAYGIATQSASGTLNMYSPAMNGVFYNSNGQFTYTSGLSTTGFNTQFALETPVSTFFAGISGNSGGSVNAPGAAASGGAVYYQPTNNRIAGSIGGTLPDSSVNPNTCHVYTFGVPQQSTGYGFFSKGQSDTSVSVAANHKSYYIQPASNGSVIRSATAGSLPSFTSPVDSYSQQVPTNVYFDKAYSNPPLIFITYSSGPVAINYFNRDGSGKFVSASIVANSTLADGGGFGTIGVAPFQGNTYSFNYFIVSDEEPVYGSLSSYGMRVFDASGSKVFDSAYFCPTFLNLTAQRPWMQVAGTTGGYSYSSNQIGITKPASYGLCINNCNAITGHGVAVHYQVGPSYFGPFSLFGRYAHVPSSTEAYVIGMGTCASHRFVGQSVTGLGATWDYTKGSTPNMDMIFCNYYY